MFDVWIEFLCLVFMKSCIILPFFAVLSCWMSLTFNHSRCCRFIPLLSLSKKDVRKCRKILKKRKKTKDNKKFFEYARAIWNNFLVWYDENCSSELLLLFRYVLHARSQLLCRWRSGQGPKTADRRARVCSPSRVFKSSFFSLSAVPLIR